MRHSRNSFLKTKCHSELVEECNDINKLYSPFDRLRVTKRVFFECLYYVYMLHCFDGSYYTGVTNDMERRFYEHQAGLIENCYTHNKRPVKLMHVEESSDIVAAISREKQIKGWSKQKKKALIAGNYQKLIELSKSHPSTSSG